MNYNILVDNCIENAKSLFKELEGEFYPFGYVVDSNDNVSPYYVTMDEEFPDVNELHQHLITSLINDLNKGLFNIIAVCSLATKKMDGITYDLLDIKTLNLENEAKDFVVVISPNTKDYTFDIIDTFETLGTIKAFYSKPN